MLPSPRAIRPQYSSSSSLTCLSGVDEASLGQVGQESADAEGPRLAFGARLHAVHQRSLLRSGNGDDIAPLMREAHAGIVPILRGREHCSKEECEPIRILMVGTDGLSDKILRIAADLCDRRRAFEFEPVLAFNRQRHIGLADIV